MSTTVHDRTQRATVLKAARRLPLPAFFCNEAKRPTCPNGLYDACQGDALDALFRRHPGPLIGVPTGPASGLAVLDVDPNKGGDTWWNENRARLPLTRVHETRSGGIHGVFQHRDGLRCSTSKIALGIDVRGERGYIVWWPFTGLSVINADVLAPWPDWLKPPDPDPPAPIVTAPFCGGSRYGAVALASACAAITCAPNGDQESTLNKESYSIGQLVGAGVIDQASAISRLLSAASAMPSYDARRPWTRREIDTKVNRAFAQGQQSPRKPRTSR